MKRNILGIACLAAVVGWTPAAFALGTVKPAGAHVMPVAPVHQHAVGVRPLMPVRRFGAAPGGAGSGQFGGCTALYPRPAGC